MLSPFIKLFLILFFSGQGLICLSSFISLVLISRARKNLPEGAVKEMVENLIALAFVTYLFTFFNILIKKGIIQIKEIIGDYILNIYIVLIIIVIIKTTADVINHSKSRIKKKKIKY